jgi:NAD(P)-dependent dehydrogenase (short-subunit alcohol dehydrogenase family)
MIITGAGRGIGAATARMAAARGYDLCLTYQKDLLSAEAVKHDCEAAGAKVLLLQGSVEDEAHAIGGTGPRGRLETITHAGWANTMGANVTGLAMFCREAVKRMSTKHGGKGGAIVNVSSRASELGSAGEYVHYAASKAAVDTLTIGLAREVAQEGMRVNAVNPGLIETEIHARGGAPDRLARLGPLVPMGRAGKPEEVAECILFLASDAASYVTSACLQVGGGR